MGLYHLIGHIRYYIFLAVGCVLLSACAEEPAFERQTQLKDNHWAHKKTLEFTFQVKPPLHKNLFYTLRHHRDYRYCNLFIRFSLLNVDNDTLQTRRIEKDLYDCQTGRPLGRGIEDWYDHELDLLPHYTFPEAGAYRLVMEHQMRPDTLRHVRAIGITIRESKK